MSYTISITTARLKPEETEAQRLAEPVQQRALLTPKESERKAYTDKQPSKKKASRQSPVSLIRSALDSAKVAFERLDTREAAAISDAELDDLFESWDALSQRAKSVFRLI